MVASFVSIVLWGIAPMENARALEVAIYAILVPGGRFTKVARVVHDVIKGTRLEHDDAIIARLFYDDGLEESAMSLIDTALNSLSERTDIEVAGNLLKWRQSEIRRLMHSADSA